MLRTVLACLLLLPWPVAAQAACQFRFSFVFDQASSGTMTATSGESCMAQVERTGSKTVIKSIKVASPPKNGTASAGSTGVTYRSRPGFKGSDAFTFTVFGNGDAGTNKTATIQMNVTVQ